MQVKKMNEIRGTDVMDWTPDMPPGPIEGPDAWSGAEMAKNDDWIHHLTDDEIAELEAASRAVMDSGADLLDIGRDEFPLPTFGATVLEMRNELLRGRGFVLIRGLPVEHLGREMAGIAYWGIGAHLGHARPQNAHGHLLGHVRDIGYDSLKNPEHRIYQTTQRQYYHTDTADIVGLLCLQQAKSGGASSIISSVSIYNEMLRADPDLTAVMFHPFYIDHRGEVPPDSPPYYPVPTFNYVDGRLSSLYVRQYIESAQRFPDVPRLSDKQIAALDLMDAVMYDGDLALEMHFRPGDIQILHNPQIFHGRLPFEDWPEPERKRHLLRLWLCPPDGRTLPHWYAGRWDSIEIGDRGGLSVDGMVRKAPLRFEDALPGA
jgi:hypothetical protein